MQVQSTHQVVGHALETIMANGGNHLYATYIKQKLPNHTNEQTQDIITRNFNLVYHNEPRQTTISHQTKPINAPIDPITPQKIMHKRSQSQIGNHPTNKNLIRMKQNNIANKTFLQNNSKSYHLKPNTLTEIDKIDESKLRREKVKSIKKQQQQNEEKMREQAKISYRRKQLESKIEQLTVQGVPYGYDDSGQLFSMDLSEFKDKKKEKPRKNNFLQLKFRTLDVNTARYNPQEIHNVTGRKRGFTSSKFYKKLRITNEDFNNQNNRQYSTIPFATIAQGVKITEKEKNIVASKTKESTVNRDQFVKQTQSRFFKSFMPDSDGALSFGGISERPMTTGQFNRTKQTAETGTGRSLRKSILWRPQTTSKTCRLNINNRQLAREFVNS